MEPQAPRSETEQAHLFGIAIGFCAGLITGFCLGAGAALAYAPKPGAEMRDQLRDSGLQVKGRVQDTLERAKQRVQRQTEGEAADDVVVLADGVAASAEAQDTATATS